MVERVFGVAVPSAAAMRLLYEISKQLESKVSMDFVRSQPAEIRVYADELQTAGLLERCDPVSRGDSGAIVRVMPAYRSLRVSSAGWAALAARQEQLDQLRDEAKRKTNDQAREESGRLAEKRRSWWQFWLGLFLGWFLGGFTPQEFWRWLMSLFALM